MGPGYRCGPLAVQRPFYPGDGVVIPMSCIRRVGWQAATTLLSSVTLTILQDAGDNAGRNQILPCEA